MLTQQLLKDGINKVKYDIKTNASKDWTFKNSRTYIIKEEYINNKAYDKFQDENKLKISKFQTMLLEFIACSRYLLTK